MKRREFLRWSGGLSTQVLLGGTIVSTLNSRRLEAATGLPIHALTSALDPQNSTVFLPSNALSKKANVSFNRRTQLAPQVRVLVKNAQAAQDALAWAVQHGVPFALRSGGHSYEGFSQSSSMVIDVRGLDKLEIDTANDLVRVGSGLALGQIYQALSSYQLAIPAGSCFTVGVAGHTLGGGYGLLARPFGLACDTVESMQMIDAKAQVRTLSAVEDQDLFWALRGGGNGNFGIVTELEFRASKVDQVAIFNMGWNTSVEKAVPIVGAWQQWLIQLPDGISCTFHLGKGKNGSVAIRLAGQSIQSESALLAQLNLLQRSAGVAKISSNTLPFIQAVAKFNGSKTYPSVWMKAKSDFVTTPLSDAGIRALLTSMITAPAAIAVMADSYGGAINRVARDQTAFVHRGHTKYSLQYYMEWSDPARSAANLAIMRKFYASLRPYVSGEAYVNYCDLDLKNFAQAYWAENLPRLVQLKSLHDPNNIFRHAQSVPLQIR